MALQAPRCMYNYYVKPPTPPPTYSLRGHRRPGHPLFPRLDSTILSRAALVGRSSRGAASSASTPRPHDKYLVLPLSGRRREEALLRAPRSRAAGLAACALRGRGAAFFATLAAPPPPPGRAPPSARAPFEAGAPSPWRRANEACALCGRRRRCPTTRTGAPTEHAPEDPSPSSKRTPARRTAGAGDASTATSEDGRCWGCWRAPPTEPFRSRV